MGEYPSLVEGTGLENQKVGQLAQGFESLFPRQQYLSRDGSSLVARRAHNPKVEGSNPSPATNWFHSVVAYHACLSRKRSRVQIPLEPPFGFIAQSVEQRTENPCVAGSIPAGATRVRINALIKGFFNALNF